MSKPDIEQMLTGDAAMLSGHFKLRSGMHSPRYLQCAQVLQHPDHAAMIGRWLAERLKGVAVDVVVGPAIGGIIVAHELARAIGCRSIFAERENDLFGLRRGFEIAAGEKVVVAEDVITTGGATQEVIRVVEAAGATAVAVASIVNRSGGNPFTVAFHYLYEFQAPNYRPEECPLCKEGVPLVKPGSRVEAKK